MRGSTMKTQKIEVVSSPEFLRRRRRELLAEIKQDEADGYGTDSLRRTLAAIEEQMREQGL
jgi:hypothetical protein